MRRSSRLRMFIDRKSKLPRFFLSIYTQNLLVLAIAFATSSPLGLLNGLVIQGGGYADVCTSAYPQLLLFSST